ncbi:MAG: single-stranded DNA-binding protein [Saprospiraceae bacterium]|nr:single-stranded DNA-binding protein [Saprospiraceae bacterium]
MKNLKNSVQLIGHLGKNPEVSNLETGKKIARFSLATNENYKSPDGKKVENTTWHNIVAWDKVAEYVQKYLAKGQEVMLHGRISNRSYKDKSGETKYISEIILSDILKLQKDNTSETE